MHMLVRIEKVLMYDSVTCDQRVPRKYQYRNILNFVQGTLTFMLD